MIRYLSITNIALITHLVIPFHNGMHVLTGETGAGKSIVIDSLNLILGGRADRELIRTGEEKATVEAEFDISGNDSALLFLANESIPLEDSTLLIWREITITGRNTCRINGVPVSVATLKEMSGYLLDIHGQHEHQFLMDPERHLSFLDQLGDSSHHELMNHVQIAYHEFIVNHRAYAALVKRNDIKERRIKELEENLTLLKSVDFKKDKEEDLKEKYDQYRYSEKIISALKEAKHEISVGDFDRNALTSTDKALSCLKSIQGYGKELAELYSRCESLYYELQELDTDLSVITEKNSFDAAEMEEIENKLDLIRKIKRRFGSDEKEIILLRDEMENELAELQDLDNLIVSMSKEHKRLLSIYRSLAHELTESRKKLSYIFEKKMMDELHQLGMEHAMFSVCFAENITGKPLLPTDKGDDKVEFMIAPNPGETPKPLARIASGGELSRIMLAFKTLEAEHYGTGTMVFDEIDTGISGRIAQVVGEKMATIAQNRQVISVTHLPQIAAMADHQYLVKKDVHDGRTVTTVNELEPEDRIAVIAAMITGDEGSGKDAVVYARSLLKNTLCP